MRSSRPIYLSTAEKFLDFIIGVILEQGDLYARVRVRFVALQLDGKWHNGYSTIRVFTKDETVQEHQGYSYPGVLLKEKWLMPGELATFLLNLETKGIEFQGESLFADHPFQLRNGDFYSSHNKYSKFPGYYFSSQTNTPSSEPLLSYDQKYFENTDEAIREWCDIPRLGNGFRVDYGTAALFFPQLTAYFESMRLIDSNKLEFVIPCRPNQGP